MTVSTALPQERTRTNWDALLIAALVVSATVCAYLAACRYGIEGYWPLAVLYVVFPPVAIFGAIGCVGGFGALAGGIGKAVTGKPREAVGGRK